MKHPLLAEHRLAHNSYPTTQLGVNNLFLAKKMETEGLRALLLLNINHGVILNICNDTDDI